MKAFKVECGLVLSMPEMKKTNKPPATPILQQFSPLWFIEAIRKIGEDKNSG